MTAIDQPIHAETLDSFLTKGCAETNLQALQALEAWAAEIEKNVHLIQETLTHARLRHERQLKNLP